MDGASEPRTAEITFIAAELQTLEVMAKAMRQDELAHFIGVARELARIVVARVQPKPAGTNIH